MGRGSHMILSGTPLRAAMGKDPGGHRSATREWRPVRRRADAADLDKFIGICESP
jgi:hypothetical protein